MVNKVTTAEARGYIMTSVLSELQFELEAD
jgi:hypothetical protein